MANYTQTDATINIKPSAGKLIGIMVTAASSTPTITVYDSAATTTTPMFLMGLGATALANGAGQLGVEDAVVPWRFVT